MFIKRLLLSIVSLILILLGSLWFLQGTGIVHLDPVMCVAECEPITTTSPLWATIGAVAVAGGVLLIRKVFKRKKQ
jgi:hypothetical protein